MRRENLLHGKLPHENLLAWRDVVIPAKAGIQFLIPRSSHEKLLAWQIESTNLSVANPHFSDKDPPT